MAAFKIIPINNTFIHFLSTVFTYKIHGIKQKVFCSMTDWYKSLSEFDRTLALLSEQRWRTIIPRRVKLLCLSFSYCYFFR